MRRALLAGVAAVVLGVLCTRTGAGAATGCVTLGYTADLTAADTAISSVSPDLEAVRSALERAAAEDTASLAVLDTIINDLDASPPDVAGAKRRLDALSGALALPPGSACSVDSQAARGLLHDVYASRVYAGLDQNQQTGLLAALGQAFNWMISHIFGTIGAGGSILLAAIVVVVVAILVGVRLRGGLAGARATAGDEPASLGNDPEAEWRQALAAAAAGDHREAIRRAFRSALLEVAGRRARLEAAWTTRELLGSITADADLLAVLATAAASFDRAWYSGIAVATADWETARDRCARVRSVARSAAAAPR